MDIILSEAVAVIVGVGINDIELSGIIDEVADSDSAVANVKREEVEFTPTVEIIAEIVVEVDKFEI